MIESLKNIFGAKMEKMRENKNFIINWISLHWSKAVGKDIDRKTMPFKFSGNILFVHVINSSWCNELTSTKSNIIPKLNENIAPLKIKDIRFSVAYPLRTKGKKSTHENSPNPFSLKKIENMVLTEEEEKKIHQITEEIKDDNLRDSMTKMLLKEEKWKKLKIQAGWKKCRLCGVLIESGEICHFCSIDDS